MFNNVMDKIFLTLLNRKSSYKENIILKNKDVNTIKNYINNTDEFKDFYQSNISKINEQFIKIIQVKPEELNTPIFMRTFINLKYDENKMNTFFMNTINHIRNEYTKFYKDYLDIEENISDEEILQILNDNYNINNFITTSDKFISLCDLKIKELTN
jgi:hypothetical protein